MGNILRKKRPPSEELDELVIQIRELEVQLKHLLSGRSSALRWLTYSTLLLLSVLFAFFWLQRETLKKRIFSVTNLVVIGGVAFLLLRYLIVFLYDLFIRKKQSRIRFTDRKLVIIEEVKENEKYNVAKELIKKYGGETESAEKGEKTQLEGQIGDQKKVNEIGKGQSNSPIVPKLYEMTQPSQNRTPIRPFVEQSRTPIDRILDFVMGESINNRYALICLNCRSHNGMALQEEFEHISFFCFKCNYFNPSQNELKMQSLRINSQKIHSKISNYAGNENTDDSTENEFNGSERRPSTVSLRSEDERTQ